MSKYLSTVFIALIVILLLHSCKAGNGEACPGLVLKAEDFRYHIEYFNRMEDENISQAIPNSESWEWLGENIPLFECPQENFEEIYYYRWWTLRKHIIETPLGYAFTEFLVKRSYADRYNLIACAMGHHIMEARWLRNNQYLDDYIHVWYRGDDGSPMAKLHKFSSYTAFALLEKYKVDANTEYLVDLLPDLDADFRLWENERKLASGLFWQEDVKDGMEESISGGRGVQNARPTINSYMFGNARALSEIAVLAGDSLLSEMYSSKADTLKALIQEKLWNPGSLFFETLKADGSFAHVREAIGFLPWMVNLPDPDLGFEAAWSQLMDPEGFLAPFGLTTAEQRHPEFRTHGCCKCEWDGAVWPFATSQTMTALQNLLQSYEQEEVSTSDYFQHMERYVESQYYRGRPYIGEYLDESTAYWLKGDQERSRYYNHSSFNDLIITGIVGLVPRLDDLIEIHPLVPAGKWDWFCLDKLSYHDQMLTILWDRDGSRYNRGKGLQVFIDGKLRASSPTPEKIIFDSNVSVIMQ